MQIFLKRYEAVVEIIFAVALFVALVYSIYMGDKVTAAAVIGGILGYMKGRADVPSITPAAPAVPAAGGEGGFATIRLLGALSLGLLLLGAVGCSTLRHTVNADVPDSIITAQETAEKVAYGFTAAFQATPPIVDALLRNGNITPHTYNTEILPAYNRGLASLKLLTAALKAAEDAKADPNHVEGYTVALARFLEDKSLLDSILTAYGRRRE